MTNAKPSFLRKAKGYKKHGAIAVLFVFVEMICLSAYRGRFNGREWYLHPVLLTSRIILRFFLSPSGSLGQNDKMI